MNVFSYMLFPKPENKDCYVNYIILKKIRGSCMNYTHHIHTNTLIIHFVFESLVKNLVEA